MPAGLSGQLASVWQDKKMKLAIVGDHLVGVSMLLEKMGEEYHKRIVLKSWDVKTGEAGDSVELAKGKAPSINNVVFTWIGDTSACSSTPT